MQTIMTLEQVLDELNKTRNWSLLCKETGISRQSLYNITRGNDPRYSTVKILSDYFSQLK